MADPNLPSPLQANAKRLWLNGFLAGIGVLIAIFLIRSLIWGWPWGTANRQENVKPPLAQAPANPAAPPAPVFEATPPPGAAANPAATLKAELEAVLARLTEANEKKDLSQLLNVYDPAFPELLRKAEEISRTWKIYDYRSIQFHMEEVSSPSPHEALARVTWKVETRNRSTQQIKKFTLAYQVRFTKTQGQWRIAASAKAGPAASPPAAGRKS
jgi:hypothetical protein